ncbi:hypothetical protein K432DRAFT_387906 [Lepidopterella palustris CBS 459.81]|uniref:Uncharacterized protein n=1 Tax=Lepidopterella palustris CBS 459.81 TaxID=1314670 RepID=A0A8E2ELI5_9PEZI|nr:hypothetical protein K432DRAFT_387906 [Lepidopterella palustris CBS 459.81]
MKEEFEDAIEEMTKEFEDRILGFKIRRIMRGVIFRTPLRRELRSTRGFFKSRIIKPRGGGVVAEGLKGLKPAHENILKKWEGDAAELEQILQQQMGGVENTLTQAFEIQTNLRAIKHIKALEDQELAWEEKRQVVFQEQERRLEEEHSKTFQK